MKDLLDLSRKISLAKAQGRLVWVSPDNLLMTLDPFLERVTSALGEGDVQSAENALQESGLWKDVWSPQGRINGTNQFYRAAISAKATALNIADFLIALAHTIPKREEFDKLRDKIYKMSIAALRQSLCDEPQTAFAAAETALNIAIWGDLPPENPNREAALSFFMEIFPRAAENQPEDILQRIFALIAVREDVGRNLKNQLRDMIHQEIEVQKQRALQQMTPKFP